MPSADHKILCLVGEILLALTVEDSIGVVVIGKDTEEIIASCEESIRLLVLLHKTLISFSSDKFGKPLLVNSDWIRTSIVESELPSFVKW